MVRVRVCAPFTNKETHEADIIIRQPDEATLQATYTPLLYMPNPPITVQRVHIFHKWETKPLSLSRLCNKEYIYTLTAQTMEIEYLTNPAQSYMVSGILKQ